MCDELESVSGSLGANPRHGRFSKRVLFRREERAFSKGIQKIIRQTDNYYARTGIQHYFIYDGNFLILVDRVVYDKNEGDLPKFTVLALDKRWTKRTWMFFKERHLVKKNVSQMALFIGLVQQAIAEKHGKFAEKRREIVKKRGKTNKTA
jgi:hypothetical protein